MDNPIDLIELSRRESERVEWKANGDDPGVVLSIVKTITAFANDIANTAGGYVVCGAKEGKDQYGFPKVLFTGLTADRFLEVENTVLAWCRDRVSPSVAPVVVPLDNPDNPGTKILVFVIHATSEAHTFRDDTKNCYYVRVGRNTYEARNGLLRELLEKKAKKIPFDKVINPEATVDDIDLPYFRNQLSEMGRFAPPQPPEDYLSDTQQLAEFIPPLMGRLPLDQVLRPRNFTLLMFGKDRSIARYYTNAYTVLSIYPGQDRRESFAQRHELTGSIIQQVHDAMRILSLQCCTIYDKTSDKPNQKKYPEGAIKEAVVNAIVHRDYEIQRPNRITVFSDRIEIESEGSLHWGVNQEKFIHGKATPKWRNQSFAYLFNKLHLSQSEGLGIPAILWSMEKEGCPAPIFEIEGDSVTCILPAHPRHTLIRQALNP